MAACLGKPVNLTINKRCINLLTFVRNGHWLRGKAPGVARSLEQRISELNVKDPAVHYRVNIGFPKQSTSRSEELSKRLQHLKTIRRNPEFEKQARLQKLTVDLNQTKEDWVETSGPHQIKTIADHYGVFEHLFGDAYFVPRMPMNIAYENSDGNAAVYYGNVLKPAQTSKTPIVTFETDEKSFYTLLLTNPDGHLTEKNSEYIHWFVGNIPGNNVAQGETIAEYFQPFPPKGTGYHRHIFILYKHDKKIDFSQFKKCSSLILSDRTFSTSNFYRERQDDMTPIGLAFFQSAWDATVPDIFRKILNMQEPTFEYDFPGPYIRPQKWFPLRQPFNLYMDKYKDPQDLAAKYLKDKLKNVHPFEAPKPRLPYPNAEPIPHHIPSWLKLEIRKKRLGWGRVNDV